MSLTIQVRKLYSFQNYAKWSLGSEYNVSRVLTDAMTLDESAYHDYSPVFMSTTSILSYGLGLGSITAIVIHSALNHRLEVWEGLKATFWRKDAPPKLAKEDVHTKVIQYLSRWCELRQ